MRGWIVAGCSLLLLVGPQARAQRRLPRLSELNLVAQSSDEPSRPGEPSARKPSDEPLKAGEPAVRKPGDEPGHRPGDPPPPERPKPKKAVLYGAGVQVRGIFVPSWFLGAFLDRSTALNSASIGGEFIRRKGNFDLVASINFGFYSPPDGNYMGRGKNPAIDVDYIQFRNLNVLAFDVAFIWHHDFLPWLSLIYGAGLGFGVVLGDIYRISNSGCTPENAGDPSKCYPKGMDLANREAWLAKNTCQGPDGPDAPCLYREDGKWPVIPIVHLLIGLNFKVTEKISIRVDGGFHDAFYCGATGHYFF
jgi:hypothetical protein